MFPSPFRLNIHFQIAPLDRTWSPNTDQSFIASHLRSSMYKVTVPPLQPRSAGRCAKADGRATKPATAGPL